MVKYELIFNSLVADCPSLSLIWALIPSTMVSFVDPNGIFMMITNNDYQFLLFCHAGILKYANHYTRHFITIFSLCHSAALFMSTKK